MNVGILSLDPDGDDGNIDFLHRARGVRGVVLSKSFEGVLPRRRNITAEHDDATSRPPGVALFLPFADRNRPQPPTKAGKS